jgi:hypothetical protein
MLPELTVSLRPNNQITIGLQNVVKKAPVTYQNRYYGRFHYDCESQSKIYETQAELKQWQKNLLADRIKQAKYKSSIEQRNKSKVSQSIHYSFAPVPPLDIIRKFQRELKLALCVALRFLALRKIALAIVWFARYRIPKPKKFSNIAGQRIREAGAAIDILCDGNPSQARVVTLTLPANHKQAFAALAAYSGYAINRLFQPIRRHFPEIAAWFFVWEHQRRGALHLHICIHCKDSEQSEKAGQTLLEQWHKVLCDISEQSGVCMFTNKTGKSCTIRSNHQNVNQVMEKSCGAYFSKYAGKCANIEENSYVHKFAKMYPPTRFWGSSKVVKDIIKENSFSFKLDSIPSDSKEKFDSLVELILEREVILFKEYEWKVETRKKFERIQKPFCYRYQNGKESKMNIESKPTKYIGVEKRIISEGYRYVFYVSPQDYRSLLETMSSETSMYGAF